MFPNIITIIVGKRRESSMKLQEVLSHYGCHIQTRVGFHETVKTSGVCSDVGLVILQTTGDKKETDKMIKEINKIKEVKAKRLIMTLDD